MNNAAATEVTFEDVRFAICEGEKVRKAPSSTRASCRRGGQDPFLQFCVDGNGARVQP